jgi:hypothetical protein
MWPALVTGVSVSLIAAAIYDYATGNHARALVMGGAGLAGFVVAYYFSKKKPEPNSLLKDSGNATANATGGAGGDATATGGSITQHFHGSSAAAPAPAPEKKDEPLCNIQFTGVGLGKLEQTHVLSKYAGQIIEYAGAGFENKAIQGEKLRVPLVKARLIFRHPDGHTVADVSNTAWIRPPSDFASPYIKLQVNTVEYVVLFWLVGGKLTCQSVIPDSYIRIGRRSRPSIRTHELNGNIGTVEIQLLTETEHLHSVLLRFTDHDDNTLPEFTGIAEPAE